MLGWLASLWLRHWIGCLLFLVEVGPGVGTLDDELLEVTPANLRIRNKLFTEVERKRESRQKAS